MPGLYSNEPKILLDQLRDAIRIKHYSYSTEKKYVHWAKRYILFHKAKQGFARHPAEMGVLEIEAFLSHPVQEANVSASTQNQALLEAHRYNYRRDKRYECFARIAPDNNTIRSSWGTGSDGQRHRVFYCFQP